MVREGDSYPRSLPPTLTLLSIGVREIALQKYDSLFTTVRFYFTCKRYLSSTPSRLSPTNPLVPIHRVSMPSTVETHT